MRSRLLSYKNDSSSKSSNFKLLEEDGDIQESSLKGLHKSHNVFQTRLLTSDELTLALLPQNTSRVKVQLFISCRNLDNVDYVGKTDAAVALYTKSDHKKGKWTRHDQTEVMNNNLNPDFMKSFILYYYFEQH